MGNIAGGLGALARLAESLAGSAGMEATFARREQEWRRQLQQANDELRELARQKQTLELRQHMAERAVTTHAKSLEQNEEIAAFFQGKFTQLGFYVWVSKRLRDTYREAFTSAQALARMAEQAFVFERGDDDNTRLSYDYWDASHGGLLAASALLTDLGHLERRYLETNDRELEITQPISLAQLDPAALASLRLKGECEFSLPEYVFDLSYPGHYRRMVRNVRLTIPCVAGPLTNIAATLTLKGSRIRRRTDRTGDPETVPLGRTNAIATSTANHDSGLFELSFRDERYLPFEGAGALSDWKLELPKAFRAFDYDSITDVIVHVSYTARASDALREQMELANGALANALRQLTFRRLFSLRREFPTEYARLVAAPVGTPIEFTIEPRHFPCFLQGQSFTPGQVVLLGVDLRAGQEAGNLEFELNGQALGTWTTAAVVGGMRSSDAKSALGMLMRTHTLKVVNAGQLGPEASPACAPATFDPAKLRDLLLYCEFKL